MKRAFQRKEEEMNHFVQLTELQFVVQLEQFVRLMTCKLCSGFTLVPSHTSCCPTQIVCLPCVEENTQKQMVKSKKENCFLTDARCPFCFHITQPQGIFYMQIFQLLNFGAQTYPWDALMNNVLQMNLNKEKPCPPLLKCEKSVLKTYIEARIKFETQNCIELATKLWNEAQSRSRTCLLCEEGKTVHFLLQTEVLNCMYRFVVVKSNVTIQGVVKIKQAFIVPKMFIFIRRLPH